MSNDFSKEYNDFYKELCVKYPIGSGEESIQKRRNAIIEYEFKLLNINLNELI